MDHYGRATKEAADGCENFLEITRFRYLHASTRLRCLWASWFLWWLLVAATQGSLKYWRLELDSLNQICCLHSALKPWWKVRMDMFDVHLPELQILYSYYMCLCISSRHPFSKQPWLACCASLLGLTLKWSKRLQISWEWKLPSRDHGWTERANETAYLTYRVLIAGLLDQNRIHPTKTWGYNDPMHHCIRGILRVSRRCPASFLLWCKLVTESSSIRRLGWLQTLNVNCCFTGQRNML